MILNRYLTKEIFLSFGATLLVLALIVIGNTFVRLLASASSGNLPVDLLGSLLLLGSIKNLIRLVPVALLIGMMLAFSRLYRDSEMTALRAAGVAPRHFYRAIFTLVIPLSLVLGTLVLYAAPRLEIHNQDLRREVQQRPEAAGIPAGEFVTAGKSDNSYTILAEHIDPTQTTMERFFIRVRNGENEILIWARSAILFIDSINAERFLQILDGYRYENDPVKGGLSIIRFGEHGIRIPLRNFTGGSDIESVDTLDLLRTPTPESLAELQWRISIVLSAPVLAFLAFPLSYTAPRQGRYSKIALGILIYGLYANLLATARSMIEKGDLPLWLGMWWIHLILLVLGFWLLRKYYGKPA
ncbi:MAG TPA: LPS export ABC transporter permease LptF [Thiolinea sp.]|nr:LPS export ABC transporter permease LptF [Thiolinea sp.]